MSKINPVAKGIGYFILYAVLIQVALFVLGFVIVLPATFVAAYYFRDRLSFIVSLADLVRGLLALTLPIAGIIWYRGRKKRKLRASAVSA